MYRLKRLLRRFTGAGQPARSTTGIMALRDRFQDIRHLLQTAKPVIVDGGASTGTVTDIFLRQYAHPTIHTFEPRLDAAQRMQAKYKDCPNVTVHACALGAADGTLTFQVVGHATSSSFFRPSTINQHYHPGAMGVVHSIDVPVVRLDSVLQGTIDLIKLDLQGYELEALKGCGDLLRQTRCIITEIEFVPLYEGQPLFGDVDVFLREKGFRLFNLYELWTQPDGQLTSGDALYLSIRHF